MLGSIKKFFEQNFEESENGQLSDHKRRLACAALLIEVATIDEQFDQSELDAMQTVLQAKFGISKAECQELTDLAKSEFQDASSTYQFTRLVNDQCNAQEKFALVQGMWAVAFADGHVDKYEEYIIRKTSELIYVPHSDFIRAKLQARTEAGQV